MFRMAKKIAEKSPFYQHRVGALIVKGNRIIATGVNRVRYSKYFRRGTLHAEQAAILAAVHNHRLSDLVGSTMYVTRLTPGGAVGISKPCPECHKAILAAGIKRVFYTTNEGTEELVL